MKTAIIINNETLGHGEEGLGKQLMVAFLTKLWASEQKPESIFFYNSGVKLLAKGSNVLAPLTGLFESGVDIAACGTCINHYGLQEEIRVGRVTGMDEIVSVMMKYDKVITV